MPQGTQLVREIYAAFAAGDFPTFLGFLDPGVRWNEAESFPTAVGNPHVGIDAVVSGVFAPLAATWGGFRVEVGEIVGDDVVTMFGRYKGTNKATGKPLDVQVAHTWWLRDGKVVRFQQMVDTARVQQAMA